MAHRNGQSPNAADIFSANFSATFSANHIFIIATWTDRRLSEQKMFLALAMGGAKSLRLGATSNERNGAITSLKVSPADVFAFARRNFPKREQPGRKRSRIFVRKPYLIIGKLSLGRVPLVG
jgi:hypothetical protein